MVFGVFDWPVAHLAFDDARVATEATGGEWLGEDLGDRPLMSGREAVGGKIPVWCGLSAGRHAGRW